MHIRKEPAPGVHETSDGATIVFVTACAKDRTNWLATRAAHLVLRAVWLSLIDWRVGRYVIMPDHVHFFATPSADAREIEVWMKHWKRLVSRAFDDGLTRWQRKQWHTRMRNAEHFNEKWDYMLENPVRRGLVQQSEDWPHQGEVFKFTW